MQKEKFISGMNGHIVLSPMERERIIQRSVDLTTVKTHDQKGEIGRYE